MFVLVVAGVFGYLLGSIPTAYLIVRWKSKIDIRDAGSGSVGAFNSFDVTRSKAVGGAVLLIDLLKGVASVIVCRLLVGPEFSIAAVGGIGATLGHNFPVWLGFKGGRGLATAAGVMFTLSPVVVLMWGVGWFAGYKTSKKINVGNAVATMLTIAIILVLPAPWLAAIIRADATPAEFRVFCAVLLSIILIRLIKPVQEFLQHHRQRVIQD